MDDQIEANTESIEKINGKLLWTNQNSWSNPFTAQTITLSSDDYDILEVFYIDYRLNQNIQSIKIPKGKNGNLCTLFYTDSDGNMYITSRPLTYESDSSYSLEAGHSINLSATSIIVDNPQAHCIPVYIIGYKTNLL